MTYGEFMVFSRDNFEMKDGVAHFKGLAPKRMNSEEAKKYYSNKLNAAWIRHYDDLREEFEKAAKGYNIPKNAKDAMFELFLYGYKLGKGVE